MFSAAQTDGGDVNDPCKRSLSFRHSPSSSRQQHQKYKRETSEPLVPPPPPPVSNSGKYLSLGNPTDDTASGDNNISPTSEKKKIFGSRESLVGKSFRKMAQLRTKVSYIN